MRNKKLIKYEKLVKILKNENLEPCETIADMLSVLDEEV